MHYTQTPPEPFSERTPVFRNISIDHVTAENVEENAARSKAWRSIPSNM